MKKILLMAMVACAFMACNGNGADVPQQDKKAFDVATTGSIDLIGAEKAKVQKAYTDAGFILVSEANAKLPQRLALKAPKVLREVQGDVEVYAYGMPENYEKMSDDQATAYMNKLFADGKSCITAELTFNDGVLAATMTMYMTGKRAKVNTIYTAKSDALYGKLPSDVKMRYWEGYIEGDSTEYADHSAFVAKVAAANEIQAGEYGIGISISGASMSGFAYECGWYNPNAEQEAEMAKKGITTPFVQGVFAIGEYNPVD